MGENRTATDAKVFVFFMPSAHARLRVLLVGVGCCQMFENKLVYAIITYFNKSVVFNSINI